MLNNDNYEKSPHYQKSWVLLDWLKKTFSNTSTKESKTLLYDCEIEMDNELNEINVTENQNSESESKCDPGDNEIEDEEA